MPDNIAKIPDYNVDNFLKRIDKLNKRAKKNNLSPITLNIIDEYDERITDSYGIETIVHFYVYEIIGETPIIDNWIYVAKIEYRGGDYNLIRSIPNMEIPPEFFEIDIHCDHCNTNRLRKAVYLIAHLNKKREIDEYKMVGTNCLSDYMNADVKSIASFYESLATFFDEELPEMWLGENRNGIRYEMRYPLDTFLLLSIAVIKKYGWMSRSMANKIEANDPYNAPQTTSERVSNFLLPPLQTLPKYEKEWRDRKDELLKIGQRIDNLGEIENTLKWVIDIPRLIDIGILEENVYLRNLAAIASVNSVSYKEFGLAASMIPAYRRFVISQTPSGERETKKSESQRFGIKGERYDIELKLTGHRTVYTAWGESQLYKFEDRDGNKFTWFSSKYQDMEVGSIYLIRGTIKNHTKFNDEWTTNLSRCKVI